MPFTIEEEVGTEGLGAAYPAAMAQRMKTLATNVTAKLKKTSTMAPAKRIGKSTAKPAPKPAPQPAAAAKTAFTASANLAARMQARMRSTRAKPAGLTQTGVRRVGAPASFNVPRQITGSPFPQTLKAVIPKTVQPPKPMMGTPPLRSAVAYESVAEMFSRQGAFVPSTPSDELIASLYGLDYPGQAFVNSLTLPKKIMIGAAAVGGLLMVILLVRKMRSGGVSGIDAFTRKDFEDVARTMRVSHAPRSEVDRWIEKFKRDNPRFREDYFRAALVGKKKDRSRH